MPDFNSLTDVELRPSPAVSQFPVGDTREGLEKIRTRLLDLTTRNRLLHFKNTKESLRIVDTALDPVCQALLAGEALLFRPVPEPEEEAARDEDRMDARARARAEGWNLDWDLAETPGQRGCLPVLVYAAELDAILRRIASAARTAVEESGFNMLYLVLGFLEWREVDLPGEPRLAPLLTIPVRLERQGGAPNTPGTWRLTYTGEDLGTNLSLIEKLRADYGMDAPLLEPLLEHGEGPLRAEAYFEQWKRIIAAEPGWRIRRQMTLAMLSFGKLLMFRDLDPQSWPEDAPIAQHPRVRELFEGVRSNDATYASEYPIDQPEFVETLPPLIFDADSSQHSALVDAVNRGRNLVIEGPPGTGKSQTITNLIAAALMMGKTVLFVAEKMAALEIVRERLDIAGLAPFCLELHSHASNRQSVLHDLKRRVELMPLPDVEDVSEQMQHQAAQRDTLNEYVRLLHRPVAGIRRSPYQILWAREAAIEELGERIGDLERAQVPGVENWTRSEFEQHEREAEVYGQRLASLLERCPDLSTHPWTVLENANLSFEQEEELMGQVAAFRDAAGELEAHLTALAQLTGVARDRLPEEPEAIERMIEGLPWLPADVPFKLLETIRDAASEMALTRFVSVLKQHRQIRRNLSRKLLWPEGLTAALQQECMAAYRELEALELAQMQLPQLQTLASVGAGLETNFEASRRLFQECATLLGIAVPFSPRQARLLREAVRLLLEAPLDALSFRHGGLEEEIALHEIEAAQAASQQLREKRSQLRQRFDLQKKSDPRQLRQWAERLQKATPLALRMDKECRDARQAWQELTGAASAPGANEMADDLRALSDYRFLLEEFQQQRRWREIAGPHYLGIETQWEMLEGLARWYRQVEEALPGYQADAAVLRERLLAATPVVLRDVVRLVHSSGNRQQALEQLVSGLDQLTQAAPGVARWVEQLPLGESMERVRQAAAAARHLMTTWETTGIDESVSPAELPEIFRQTEVMRRLAAALEADATLPEMLGSYWNGLETDPQPLQNVLDFASTLRAAVELPAELLHWLLHPEMESRLALVREELTALAGRARKLEPMLREIERLAGPSARHRLDPPEPAPAAERQRRAAQMAAEPGALAEWLQFLRARESLAAAGLGAVPEAVEQGWLRPAQAASAVRFVACHSLARQIMSVNGELHRFDGLMQESARRRFAQLDEHMIRDVARRHIAATLSRWPIPEGNGTGPLRRWTELNLIRHEVRKQKHNLPIRQLVQRAGRALQALKPCFLMSPMSVAQYLEPGQIKFDLVIMDEASQLTPEDAIGSIARGNQLVIVGDSKQLPPSNFFQRHMMDGVEDLVDATVVEDGESILDVALSIYQPARRLRWHYRSRHHSLITFSNQAFYDENLILFPATQPPDQDLGISYVAVNGVYEDQRNVMEAEQVVAAVLDHIHRFPDKSLGVLTINFPQRQLIEERLDQALQNDMTARRWMRKMRAERRPFFIKNLENAQGDERDSIFISVTWGPDGYGNIQQRFGLTAGSGHRRLNVLFTRARDRVVIFNSLNPDRIRIDRDSPFGLKVLKEYLTNARDGELGADGLFRTGPGNDFERTVGQVLRRHGYEAVYQLGFSRSVIDVAVKHPNLEGHYILGVECDGPTYQAAHSTRDRDRLREMNLRAVGWNLHRIWTTDWFRRRRHEEQRLVEAVEKAMNRAAAGAAG